MNKRLKRLTIDDVKVPAGFFNSDNELLSVEVTTPEETVTLLPEHVVIGEREARRKAEAERDQAAQQERDRLGMEKCPNPECEEGVVCVTGTERGPEGEPIPVPEQERCPTCGGHGFISAFTRAAVKAAAQQERERVKEALLDERTIEAVARIPWDNAFPGAWDKGLDPEDEEDRDPRPQARTDVRSCIKAALTTLDKETD